MISFLTDMYKRAFGNTAGHLLDWTHTEMPRGGPRLRTPDGKLNDLGGRVQQRRDELKITQDELCARIATETGGAWTPAWQDISRIENGVRTVTDLEVRVLARVLECPPSFLLIGAADNT
jgi:hypothetical protein